MNRETTRIDLPPPRMIHPRKTPTWVWILTIAVALGLGAGAGLWFGKDRDTVVAPSPPAVTDREVPADVSEKVAAARAAVAQGDWLEARRLFEEVEEVDPTNADALASLPLIERRLDEARGSVSIETEPPGATAEVAGFGSFETPATVSGLPLGEHRVTISRPGFETVNENVSVTGEELVSLGPIVLRRVSGKLEVVSEPKAEFRLMKRVEDEVELVKVGETPALIEALDPGDYEVLFAVAGFPEQSERVRVEDERNSSVSAVFAKGGLSVTSDPVGAEVWIRPMAEPDSQVRLVGKTPVHLDGLPAGRHGLELRYEDWAPIHRTVEVADGVTEDLEFSWERALATFESDPPGAEVYLGSKRLGNGRETTPFRVELPEGDYRFSAQHPQLGRVEQSVYLEADAGTNVVDFGFSYGSVSVTSEPSGAAVLSNGVPIGRTPLALPVVPPGVHSYLLRKEQHRDASVSGTVEAGGTLEFTAKLKYDPAPVTSRSFTNGLGMELSWVPALNGWVGVHETTQASYERVMGSNPSYFKKPEHPVDSVTWYDAVKFCEGLTVLEGGLGNLPAGYRYRLPTDAEWSRLVGDAKLDQAISSLFDRKKSHAPVGSLAPNEFGLHDVRGNVWEWVGDWYSQTIVNRVRQEGSTPNEEWIGTDRKVLRGGGWTRSSQFDLAIGNRMAARPSAEDRYDVGFRVVLMAD